MWFFGWLSLLLVMLLVVPTLRTWQTDLQAWWQSRAHKQKDQKSGSQNSSTVVTTSLLAVIVWASSGILLPTVSAESPAMPSRESMLTANKVTQAWSISQRSGRLTATGKISVTGRPGDQFILLNAPAVLTKFEGEGLRLTKQEVPEKGLVYTITIPMDTKGANEAESNKPQTFEASFEYQLEAIKPTEGISILTGKGRCKRSS